MSLFAPYSTMKLYIAEKPSLARALADVLPKPLKKAEGYIQLGNGDLVSWCIGHLLEQAEPEVYDSRYQKWRSEDLPIVPERWQLVAKSKTRKQLNLLKRASLCEQGFFYFNGKGDTRPHIRCFGKPSFHQPI